MSGKIIGRDSRNNHYFSVDETGEIVDTIMTAMGSAERIYTPEIAYTLLQFMKGHERRLFIHAYLDYVLDEPTQETRDAIMLVIRRFISNSLDRYPLSLGETVEARTQYIERILMHPDVHSLIERGYISVRQVATYVVDELKDQIYPTWMSAPKTERELRAEVEALASKLHYRVQFEDGLIDLIPQQLAGSHARATTVGGDRDGLLAALDWLNAHAEREDK